MTLKDLILARKRFGTNDPASGLPGREDKIRDLESFLIERLKIRKTIQEKRARVEAGLVADIRDRHCNKTAFVCGVPGTGKTAVVLNVVNNLHKQQENCNYPSLHKFEQVYVNAQQISSPERIYSEIYYKMTGVNVNAEKAQTMLDRIFSPKEAEELSSGENNLSSKRKKTAKIQEAVNLTTFKVVIIDEIDLLYNEKKLSIFYTLFDWTTSDRSKIILIAIANAMDLPERFARGRISSRIGWNKIIFEPYKKSELEDILKARLGDDLFKKCFDQSAIILAIMRIGKTTGDARRIIDTCSLAVDEAIRKGMPKVTVQVINNVGFHNLDKAKIKYVKQCPPLQLLTLQSILKETDSQGESNVRCYGVYNQLNHLLASSKNIQLATRIVGYEEFHMILNHLNAVGLICLEGSSKTLMEKHLYIKDTSESFRDIIRSGTVNIVPVEPDKIWV